MTTITGKPIYPADFKNDPGAVSAAPLLDEAVAARLVDIDMTGVERYRFRHALVREVLVQGLSAVERARLHTRVAQALEQHPDSSTFAPRR